MVETGIQIVWSIGLFGALVGTAVILKLVALTLRALLHIERLGGVIRDASDGLARNLEAVTALGGLEERARRLRKAEAGFLEVAVSIERTAEDLRSAKRGS